MTFISKRVQLIIILIVLLMLAIVLGYAGLRGLLRPLYFAAFTEIRLERRGSPPVRIRLSPRDEMNQLYIPAGGMVCPACLELS